MKLTEHIYDTPNLKIRFVIQEIPEGGKTIVYASMKNKETGLERRKVFYFDPGMTSGKIIRAFEERPDILTDFPN